MCQRKICSPVAALFTRAKKLEQPECLPADKENVVHMRDRKCHKNDGTFATKCFENFHLKKWQIFENINMFVLI